jgi:hypothetical protein
MARCWCSVVTSAQVHKQRVSVLSVMIPCINL